MNPTRREFNGLALFTLLACVTRSQAWAQPVPAALQRWIRRLGEIGHAVQSGTMEPGAWQAAMQELYAGLSPEELVAFIDLDRLVAGITWPAERIGAVTDVAWPQVEGFNQIYVDPTGSKQS